MKIRDDLEGVVYVQTEGGVVALSAGDTVPAGAEVGDHVAAPARRGRPPKSVGDGDDAAR